MKNSKYIYFGVIFFVIIGSLFALNKTSVSNKAVVADLAVNSLLAVSDATISISTTQVCQFETPSPIITFTGSGGVKPYTFIYKKNNGADQIISTNGNNSSVSLGVNTNTSGNFTYTIISVEDGTGTVDTVNGSSVQIQILPSPDTSLGGTGSGTTFEGVPVFKQCNNITSSFTFTNTTATASLNTNYNISWGDGSSDFDQTTWSSTSHTYDVGIYNLVYTIEGSNGCDRTTNYTVFVGSNPAVSLGNPGNTDICNTSPLTFPITGTENNPPGTTYTVTFNDGSAPQTFSHPPPSNITHTFLTSSCDTVSSDGTNEYQNSFSAIIVALNPCSASSVGVVPIYVSIAPEADFDLPDSACTNTQVCFTNTSTGEENNGLGSSCDTSPNIIWEITPTTGYTITSGNLGNDFGSSDSNLWSTGSDDLCLNFTQGGTYTITLNTGNRCGIDSMVKTICVEDILAPIFTSSNINGCAPFSVVLNNTTNETDQCGVPNYEWIINYTADYCGTANGANFINGTNSTSENPEIEFTNPGTYEVILQGTNSCGTISSPAQEIVVKAAPQVAINEITDFCETPSIISPSPTVDSCGPDAVTYNWGITNGVSPTDWEFINGTTATSESPEISFYTANSYVLTLEVSTSCGTATDSEEFMISPVPTITNTETEQTLCSGAETTAILLESNNSNTTYQWSGSSPTGNVSGVITAGTSNEIPAHMLTLISGTSGSVVYTVTPYLVDNCPGEPFVFTINVNAGPSVVTQPLDGAYCTDAVANPITFTLSGNTTGAVTYQWYYNETGINDPVDPNTFAIAAPEGTQADYQPPTDTVNVRYYFCVVSLGGTGSCSEISTIPAVIEVTPNAEISAETPLNQTVCAGADASELSFTINDGGAGTIIYNWYASNDAIIDSSDTPIGTNATVFDPGVLNTPGIYYYYVTVDVDENLGCDDVSSNLYTIEVVEDPEVIIAPIEQNICTNVTAQLLIAETTGGIDVNADGVVNNTDYQFQWFLNGNPVSEVNDTDGDVSTFNHDSALPAGVYNYYCEISQPNNLDCKDTSNTVSIIVSEGPSITAQPIDAVYCLGDTMAALEVVIENGVGVPDYQWYSNNTNDTDTPNPIGTNSNTLTIPNTNVGVFYYYCIISSSEGGCGVLTTQIVAVSINQIPEITDYSELICSNNQFSITPDSSNGNIVPLNTTYTWTAPAVNPFGAITGASAEATPSTTISQFLENNTINPATVIYTITPRSGDCIGDTFEVVVTVNPSISVSAIATDNSCFESNNASIEITISGGVPFTSGNPYTITWDGPNGFTSTDEDLFNLEIGTYVLNIMDDGGCPFSETFTIIEPEDLVFSTINFDPETISCFGADDGVIDITIDGGTLPYAYTWTKNGTPFSTNEDLADLGPGNYEINVTDANNCGPITQSFLVEEPSLLAVALESQTNVICFDDATGSIAINVTGGRPNYTYSWSGPDAFVSSTQNIDNLLAGTYTVVVSDSSGCTDTLSFVITQNDQIVIDVTSTEIKCYGDNDASITINNISGGVPPYNTVWSNFGTGAVQTNLSAGIYTVTITDALNCSRSFPIEIEEAPLFLIEPVATQMSCAGENDARIVLNLQGGIDPVTVVWDDDSSAGVERNNLAPGTYSVTITDGTPCVIQESFTIFDILPLQLSANVTHALDCDDTNSGAINLLIAGGTPPFNVLWSNAAVTEDLENIPANTYYVTITDAKGCEIEGSWAVNRFEPLVLDVDTQTEVDCETQSITQTFVAMASGGVPPFQYTWSSGTVSGMNNELMTTDNNGLVILEVIDSQGCSSNFNLNVEIPVLGQPDFQTSSVGYTNYGIFSIQDPIQFTTTATGDYVSVLWDFGDGNFSAEINPIHTYLKVGNYVVSQTVTYPFGCVYTHIVTLSVEKGYQLIMPNAFTPNADGLNDFFGPEYIGLKRLDLLIYDTWGSLVYSESGEDIRGWDGRINNQEAENGNYYYTFSARTFYDEVIEKKGPFVFIK